MGRRTKSILCLAVYCFIAAFVIPCAAQEKGRCVVEGTVLCAETDTPIAGAFVSFIKDNKIVASCLCDGDGAFSMSFINGAPDAVSASMLGYAPAKTQARQGGRMTIRLKEKKLSIKASTVTSSVIEHKGDTTSYSAGAFRDQKDMTVADILKKIPGLTVTRSGTILHNGESITKFYVEGLDLMGGRYGSITNNLSADDIAKVEVYRNHQPIKALRGISHTGKSAVNIVLKESSKNTWLFNGDLTAGAPPLPLFEAKALVTRFSGQSQDLYMLKGNNTGVDIMKEIREQAYFGKTGAFLVTPGEIDNDMRSELTPMRSTLELPQEFWYDNITGIGSFNHLHKTGPESQLRTSAQIAAEKFSNESYSRESISFDDAPELVIEENKTAGDMRYYFNAAADYEKNASKNFLSNNLSVSGQLVKGVNSTARGTATSAQQYNLPSLKVENYLKTTTALKNRKALDFTSKTTFTASAHSTSFRSEAADIGQTLNGLGFRTNNNLSYKFRAGNVGFTSYAGINLEHIRRESILEIPYELDWVKYEDFSATSVMPSASLNATYTKGGASLGASMHATLNMIFTPDYGNRIFPDLSPEIHYRQKLGQSFNLGANARYSRRGSEAIKMSKAVIMKSYRSAQSSEGMATSDNVTADIYVKYSNTPAMLFMTLSGNFSYLHNDMTNSNIYNDIFVLSSLVASPVSNRSWGVKGSISKYFGIKAFFTELSGGYDRSASGEFLQEKYFTYSSEQAFASLKARTSALAWLSAEISADYTFDRMVGNSSSGRHSVISKMDLSVTPVKPLLISFKADYFRWASTSQQLAISNVPILKLYAAWKFKKFSIFAECRNLLGANEFKKESFNPHETVSHVFHLRGREYLAGIRMSL